MAAARNDHLAGRSLSELLGGIAAVRVTEERDVTGLALDSRRVQAGEVFFATLGGQARGHDYVPDALARGAAAVIYDAAVPLTPRGGVPHIAVDDLAQKLGLIAERFFGEPTRDLFVVGVTGTNGKTSVSHYLAQALHRPDGACAVIGTLGNGYPGRLEEATHTTPDAIALHELMARFRAAGAQAVVMEASSHALDQGRVNGVNFAVAVFTNLSRDHLDYHGDMVRYGTAKQRLFALPSVRYAVVNGDDAYGREILATLRDDVEVVSYGYGAPVDDNIAHVQGAITRLSREGIVLQVCSKWGEGEIRSRLMGRFNGANLLAVLATLLIKGMPYGEACARLADLQPVPGRMECQGGCDGLPLVAVDYAHTPAALEQVLSALREHCAGKLWCVFGCGGDRDRGKRPLMGAAAERLADCVVVTDDNPRGEDARHIVAEILAGMQASETAKVIHDRRSAIAYAVSAAAAEDVVLIAGKGHETYQQIGAHKLPFNDREQVLAQLQGRGA